jgi:hypothetical protein
MYTHSQISSHYLSCIRTRKTPAHASVFSYCSHERLVRTLPRRAHTVCLHRVRASMGKVVEKCRALVVPSPGYYHLCGCPRSSFELLTVTACLGDYLNSVSVVENYMEHSIISEAGLPIKGHSESGRYLALRIENLSLMEGCPVPPVPWRQSIDARDSGGMKSPFKRGAKLPVRDGIARSP